MSFNFVKLILPCPGHTIQSLNCGYSQYIGNTLELLKIILGNNNDGLIEAL